MGEVSRGRVGLFAAALVALAAFAAVASGAKLSTKTATVTLPPLTGETQAATAKCPKGTKATGGGLQLSAPTDDFFQGSYPVGKRRWTATGARNSGPEGAELTAFARCLKDAKVSTETASLVLPADNNAHNVTAMCPRGTKVGGGGVQVSNDDFLVAAPDSSFPSGKRTWTAVGETLAGAAGIDLTASARCLKHAKLVRSSATVEMPDDSEAHSVTVNCPNGKAVGGGVELSEPTSEYPQGSYPVGKRSWTAWGYDSGLLTAHVVCLKKPKKK
jgi:hypothetical protein